MDGLIFLAISIFVVYHAFSLHSFGDWALSPGLFPLILGLVLLIFSLVLIGRGSIGKDEAKRWSSLDWKTTTLSIALSLGYILSLPSFHFNISTLIYSVLFLLLLGVRSIPLLLTVPVGLTLSIYYIFGSLLRVVLP